MAPENLRVKTKFDRLKALLLPLSSQANERNIMVYVLAHYDSEEIYQISAPFNHAPKHEAIMALELIKYYVYGSLRPSYLSSISEVWLDNIPGLK